jgi:uncharacterized membrane protein
MKAVDLLIRTIGIAIELAGVAVIAGGLVFFTVVCAASLLRHGDTFSASEVYARYRRGVGRAILLGLEFLVAADIIRTVAVRPTLRQVAVLAGIVLIRTFLSVALQVETEGRWPWRPPG